MHAFVEWETRTTRSLGQSSRSRVSSSASTNILPECSMWNAASRSAGRSLASSLVSDPSSPSSGAPRSIDGVLQSFLSAPMQASVSPPAPVWKQDRTARELMMRS